MSGEGQADDAARGAMRRLTEGLHGVAERVEEGIAAVRREIGGLDRAELDRHVVADHPDLADLSADTRKTADLFAEDPPA